MLLEICVDALSSAIIAKEAGAGRLELCSNLSIGGTTPSYGLMRVVRNQLDIDIFTIIRPRSGDFCYSKEEFEVMKEDVLQAKHLGMDGIVIGMLNPDGTFDLERMAQLVELAAPLKATLHRAFDMARNPMDAIPSLIDIGFTRILTSGLESSAHTGRYYIAGLQQQYGDDIIIMPGGGICQENIDTLIDETGCREYHMSGLTSQPSPMTFRNDNVSMGNASIEGEYTITIADPDKIRGVKIRLDRHEK